MKVLLFPGCLYAAHAAPLVDRYHDLLTSSGLCVKMLPDVMCCGFVYRDLGDEDAFKSNGDRLAELIRTSSADAVVSLCPTCNRHFEKHLKRRCGLDEEIKAFHVSTFLFRRGIHNTVRCRRRPRRKIVGYQDPCWLGRRSGDYDSARIMLKSLGYEVRDGACSRQFAECCGYAGLVPLFHPKLSRLLAEKRIGYFKDLGVECVVTACPRCYLGLKKVAEPPITVMDLVELLDVR